MSNSLLRTSKPKSFPHFGPCSVVPKVHHVFVGQNWLGFKRVIMFSRLVAAEVLVVDAFDVLLQRSLTEVLQTYERLAGRTRTRWAGKLSVMPVVFGGETGCDE